MHEVCANINSTDLTDGNVDAVAKLIIQNGLKVKTFEVLIYKGSDLLVDVSLKIHFKVVAIDSNKNATFPNISWDLTHCDFTQPIK